MTHTRSRASAKSNTVSNTPTVLYGCESLRPTLFVLRRFGASKFSADKDGSGSYSPTVAYHQHGFNFIFSVYCLHDAPCHFLALHNLDPHLWANTHPEWRHFQFLSFTQLVVRQWVFLLGRRVNHPGFLSMTCIVMYYLRHWFSFLGRSYLN